MPRNKKNNSTLSPFSLRLSRDQRERLEHDSAGLSMGEFIRQRIFDESTLKRRTHGKHPVRDHKVIGQLLGQLGASRLASNMNQIAKSMNIGSFHLTTELQTVILEACTDIYKMRKMLLKALGLH